MFHERSRGPGLEKAFADPLRARSDNGEVCVAIDVAHTSDLALLVFIGILYDAQGIGPEIPDPKRVRDVDSVANGLGEIGRVNAVRVCADVGCSRAMGLCLAPHVAEG